MLQASERSMIILLKTKSNKIMDRQITKSFMTVIWGLSLPERLVPVLESRMAQNGRTRDHI
jgi:hypothetical protein